MVFLHKSVAAAGVSTCVESRKKMPHAGKCQSPPRVTHSASVCLALQFVTIALGPSTKAVRARSRAAQSKCPAGVGPGSDLQRQTITNHK